MKAKKVLKTHKDCDKVKFHIYSQQNETLCLNDVSYDFKEIPKCLYKVEVITHNVTCYYEKTLEIMCYDPYTQL